VIDNISNQVCKLFGHGIAHGVRKIDCCGAGGNSGLENPTKKVPVTARSVLGRKLNIVGKGFGIFYGFHSSFYRLLPGHFQLVFQVEVGCGNEGVNPWFGGMADGLPGTVDIIFGRTCQCGNLGFFEFGCNHGNRI